MFYPLGISIVFFFKKVNIYIYIYFYIAEYKSRLYIYSIITRGEHRGIAYMSWEPHQANSSAFFDLDTEKARLRLGLLQSS